MRLKRLLAPVSFALLIAFLPPAPAAGQKAFDKAVKKVEASFSPAEAKPGQTVTFTVTIDLNDGFHTYPLVQSDKMAVAMVNEIKFPDPSAIIFVGMTEDPKDTKTKAELDLGIAELRYCTGTVTYTRKAVISPNAKPGATAIKLPTFKVSVCDKDNCFPPKAIPVEATLKVLDAAPVPVEKEFAEEVKKALEKPGK